MKLRCVFFILVTLGIKHAGAACYSGEEYKFCDQCNGDCANDNGCYCANDLKLQCIPRDCALTPNLNICCPKQLFWSLEEKCCSDEAICHPSCLSDEKCELVNDKATCVCNKSVHNKKTINDLKPSVICRSDTMDLSLSRCLLEYLGYDPESLRLNGSDLECNTTYNATSNNQSTINIQGQLKQNWCGTVVTNDSSHIYYKNTVNIGIQNKPIITVNPIQLDFTCSYNRSMTFYLNISNNIVKKTVYLSPVNGMGSYPLTLTAYKDSALSQVPISEDDTIEVGSYIYLGFVVENADAEKYSLKVENCIASPVSNRDNAIAVTFLKGGCPVGEITTSVLGNGKSLESRIRISSFTFNGYNGLYIFCDARLCTQGEQCDQCTSSRSAGGQTQEISIEVKLQDNFDVISSSSNIAGSLGVMAGCLFMYHSNKLVW
ncbi:pancreatic secretory granule membrane major glycoprotein GP2-like [Spea bombifrons]|uniref:pancreatic secretory granule membrane major glycoprotein GP2-like n=1 Tax=Spea bombifrons TaxID=233779 RepID=UPI00234A08AC|nr:pancreatic secretory granule membrane major glycoprotein GP2-like [Spea bombifrons]